MKAPILIIVSFGCVVVLSAQAIAKRATISPVVAKFGGECRVAPILSSSRLKQLIQKTKDLETSSCNSAFCDGAFTYDLNGDARKEYFVRLGCGATGNCTWGVFSDRPARLRGTFTAWFFYIHKRSGSWSELSTYTREGGDRGVIATLANRTGRYVETSQRAELGDYRDPQPFLTRMGIPRCEVSGTQSFDKALKAR